VLSKRHVAEQKVSDVPSLGQGVPWSTQPLDDESLTDLSRPCMDLGPGPHRCNYRTMFEFGILAAYSLDVGSGPRHTARKLGLILHSLCRADAKDAILYMARKFTLPAILAAYSGCGMRYTETTRRSRKLPIVCRPNPNPSYPMRSRRSIVYSGLIL
jgi:hypothetical protein